MTTPKNDTYQIGYADGLAWDLDGFSNRDAVLADRTGWDSAALSALGRIDFLSYLGFSEAADLSEKITDEEFSQLCEFYNEGAHAGACAPQDQRTGRPPLSEQVPHETL